MGEKFERSTKDRRKLYTLIISYKTEIEDKGNITAVELDNPQVAYIGEEKNGALFLCRASNIQDTAVLIAVERDHLITDGESISPVYNKGNYGAVDIYCPARDSISRADKQKREGFLRILRGLGL